MAPAIGIDLGTSFSCVAVYKEGQVEIIPNSYGKRISPSMVAFKKDQRLLGESAAHEAAWNPVNTVYEIKRLMGKKFDSEEVQADVANVPYKVIEKDGKLKVEVDSHGTRKTFLPEEISSFILSHMKQIAEQHLETTIEDAVITVPAYFDNNQREATKVAGEIAGLNVLRVINEPTAAALAYGFDRENKSDEDKKILVFDLGGGTYDVSLLNLEIEENGFEVLAVSGDTHLGGADFTNRLLNYMIQTIEVKTGKNLNTDNVTNKRAKRRLYAKCEEAKIRLSMETETTIEIDELLENVDVSEKITRTKFEELCSSLFEKLLGPLQSVIDDAKIRKADIDEIVLVGGSSRIPHIQQQVSQFFDGKALNTSIHPDEAVAYGAAIQAAILSGSAPEIDFTLLDVIPMSLGFRVRDKSMKVIFEKNTKIPNKRTWKEGFEVRQWGKIR